MNIGLIFYIIAAIFFFLGCIEWPFVGKCIPLGLLFFTLGHIVSGITFKAS